MQRCPLWTKYVKNPDGSPRDMPDPPVDYIGVSVDGLGVKAPRDNGGGPDGRSLRADEDLDTVRAMYVPHDGKEHTIGLTFRRNGQSNYIAQITVPARICVNPKPRGGGAEVGYNEPRTIAEGLNSTLDHAKVMGLHVVNMAQTHTAQMGATQGAHLSALLSLYNSQMLANAAQSRALQEQAVAMLATTQQTCAAAVDGMKSGFSEALAASVKPSIFERFTDFLDSPVAELGIGFAAKAWEKAGGLEGVKAKVAGFAGAEAHASAAQGLAEMGLAAVDRFSEALETKAALDAGMMGVKAPLDDAGDFDEDGEE